MAKEQEIIVVEELEQLIEKSKDLSEEEFYTIFTIHEVQNIATVLSVLKEKDKELEKKNKIIDEMLQEFTDCEFELKCSDCNCECEKDYDQLYTCNKQYFEKKAEERK